jgi:hypothetical protein
MINVLHRSVPIIFAVVVAFSLAGCAGKKQSPQDKMQAAFADVRAEIQSVVVDPERAAQADHLIMQLDQTFTDAAKSIKANKDRLRELNADYAASRADMDVELELILSAMSANQQNVLAIRKELTALLTPEEWEAIDKARSKAVSAAVKALDVT